MKSLSFTKVSFPVFAVISYLTMAYLATNDNCCGWHMWPWDLISLTLVNWLLYIFCPSKVTYCFVSILRNFVILIILWLCILIYLLLYFVHCFLLTHMFNGDLSHSTITLNLICEWQFQFHRKKDTLHNTCF